MKKDVIERIGLLDTAGAVVYAGAAAPLIACYVGIKAGRLWYHLGDVPHWGPRLEDLETHGTASVHFAGPPFFYLTGLENTPEIRTGDAINALNEARAMMTRSDVLELLGDPPEETNPPDAPPSKPPVESDP
jgi:hypothetical protein